MTYKGWDDEFDLPVYVLKYYIIVLRYLCLFLYNFVYISLSVLQTSCNKNYKHLINLISKFKLPFLISCPTVQHGSEGQ